MVLLCTNASKRPAVTRSNSTIACIVQAVLGFQLLQPSACTRWQVGGAKMVWVVVRAKVRAVVRVVTTWLGGTAGEWCQFLWPQSRGSLPPPPTRGCCWIGTHTQTDAFHLQSQSRSCLVEDDQWCQRLQHNSFCLLCFVFLGFWEGELQMFIARTNDKLKDKQRYDCHHVHEV